MASPLAAIGSLYLIVSGGAVVTAAVRTVRRGASFDLPHALESLGLAGLLVWGAIGVALAGYAVAVPLGLLFRRLGG